MSGSFTFCLCQGGLMVELQPATGEESILMASAELLGSGAIREMCAADRGDPVRDQGKCELPDERAPLAGVPACRVATTPEILGTGTGGTATARPRSYRATLPSART